MIDLGAELLLVYSTQWFSILGHQMQADPNPEWVHVDPEFHELGTMPYSFKVDADFSADYAEAARARICTHERLFIRASPLTLAA